MKGTDIHHNERMRRNHALAAEIGPLPPVADPARRARAEADAVVFSETYCASLFAHAIPPRLAEYAHAIQQAVETKSGLVHVRLARGAGKTSLFKSCALWAIATGRVSYLVIIGATQAQANAILADLWRLVEGSSTFAGDYPEIAVPCAALEGKWQRAASQTVDGEPTNILRRADEIRFPSVAGSPASAACIVARGAGGSVRGLVRGASRPDFVLLDDLQKRADALSPVRVRKLESWIQSDIMGLAGSSGIAGVLTSTPIAPHDLSELYAGPDHPEWRLIEFPLVIRGPAKEQAENWKAYDSLFLSDLAAGDATGRNATAYLQARPEMLEGIETLDPLAYGKHEINAYQRARNLQLKMGREAFSTEYQLQVPKHSATVELTPQMVSNTTTGFPRFILPPNTSRVCAFADVGTTSRIHFAVVAIGRDNIMQVVDYGTFPERGRIVPPKATEAQADALLARALVAVGERLYSQEYRTADGKREALYSLVFDEGWKAPIVRRVCTLFQRRGYRNTLPAKGVESTRYNPAAHNVLFRASNVDLRKMEDGTLSIMQNADYWKEYTQRAFLGTPLQSGSLCLFGDAPAAHHEFALQITGEKLTDKAISNRGLTLYRWTRAPGAENHYLDAVAGCLASMAHFHFLTDGTLPEVAQKTSMGAEDATGPTASETGTPNPAKHARRHKIRLRR